MLSKKKSRTAKLIFILTAFLNLYVNGSEITECSARSHQSNNYACILVLKNIKDIPRCSVVAQIVDDHSSDNVDLKIENLCEDKFVRTYIEDKAKFGTINLKIDYDNKTYEKKYTITDEEKSNENLRIKMDMAIGKNIKLCFDFWILEVNYKSKHEEISFSTSNPCSKKLCLILGHRGSGENTDNENTIDGFKTALEKKYDGVELDVQLTSSSEPVVYHDFKIKESDIRSSDKPKKKRLSGMTHEEFLKYCGNDENTDEKNFTTFSNVLKNYEKTKWIVVEVKYDIDKKNNSIIKEKINIEKMFTDIFSLLVQSERKQIIVASFHPYVLLLAKTKFPKFNVFHLTENESYVSHPSNDKTVKNAIKMCKDIGLDGLICEYDENVENANDTLLNERFKIMYYNVKSSNLERVKESFKDTAAVVGFIVD